MQQLLQQIKTLQIENAQLKTRLRQLEARSRAIDEIHDAVIGTDMQPSIVYWNKAAERLTGYTAEEAIGQHPQTLLRYQHSAEVIALNKNRLEENGYVIGESVFVTKEGRELAVEWTARKFAYEDGQQIHFAVARDITNHRDHLKQQAQLIADLQEAVRLSSALKGLLMICASCHRIRDDEQWESLEKFIQERTNAEFSHGICSDCAKELYADLYSEVEPELLKRKAVE